MVAKAISFLDDKICIVCLCAGVPIEPVLDVLYTLMELHLSENGSHQTLHLGGQVEMRLLLHHPVKILDAKHLGVNVCLDVVAERTHIVLELVDTP